MSKGIAAVSAALSFLALAAAPADAYLSWSSGPSKGTVEVAAPYGPDKADYTASPFMAARSSIPYVLIVMSKNLRMFQQGYPGLVDMDGDGKVDTGFNPAVEYVGYFDSRSCYAYSGNTNTGKNATYYVKGDPAGYFVRSGPAVPDKAQAEIDAARPRGLPHYIASPRSVAGVCPKQATGAPGDFSGNWLNYMATSRMDAVRKILYGGTRGVDSKTETYLEGSYVPQDSTVWGTEVRSDDTWAQVTPSSVYFDISDFTPFQKPASGSAHFFARGSDLSTSDRFPAIRVLPDATADDFNVCSSCVDGVSEKVVVTSPYARYWDWVLVNRPLPDDKVLKTSGPAGALGGAAKIKVYRVSVRSCEEGNVGEGESCTRYPGDPTVNANGILKPTGLLQKYGQSSTPMYFGLMTGSYSDNRYQGGVLRNHIGPVAGTENSDANAFVAPVDVQSGRFTDKGMIKNIDRLIIAGRKRAADPTTWDGAAYWNGYAWGNPVGEMLFEAVRYMSGATTPTQSFSNYADTDMAGSTAPELTMFGYSNNAWSARKPAIATSACAKPVILLISDITPERDGDTLWAELKRPALNQSYGGGLSSTDIPATFNLDKYLAAVTKVEGLDTSGDVLYYYSSGRTDSCAPKKLASGLKSVMGVCPESPALEGTYAAAAVAYYSHIHDFNVYGAEDAQPVGVDVYAVTMSPAFPELAFPVKDAAGKLISTVSILPVNISASVYGYPLQSFLNYFIIDWDTDRKGMSFHASVKVNFSDADETGDWEGDGQVTFVVDLLTDASTPGSMRESAPVTFDSGDSAVRANPDGSPAVLYKFANPADADTTDDFISIDSSQVKAILVRAYWVTTGTGAGMAMGYTISGTKRDGTYLGLTMNTPPPSEKLTPKDCQYLGFATSSAQGCGKQVANVKEQSRIFAIAESSSQVQALPNPLYLAAKYGGFDDANRNNVPDAGEWENPDGTPKTYFQATNISQLPTKLEAAFRTIARSVSSGTATSASIDTILGGGVSVQTIYYPEYSNPLNPDQKVKWAGSIVGLFVDKWGNLREDADQNGVLDQANGEAGSKGDPVVTFNSTTKEASNPPDCYKFGDFISRCFDAYGNNGLTLYRSPEEAHPASIHRIRPLFDTGKWLSRLSDEKLQSGSRGYAQAATQGAGKRRIYYGRPGGGEGLDLFDVSNSAALSKLLLHEDFGDHLPGNLSRAEASERLIRWIVGTDQPGWRPRVVGDPWGDNITPVTWRLGDVINSKPILVGAPTSNFDLLYGDRSYLAFRKAHAARRQMAYFGANDGMLHAVNVGFNGSLASGKVSFTPGDSSGGRPAHELGAEIWALIPGSLLAHLQFLPDPKYGHTYYVDLKPLIVDVKGGTAESPQWKTVLIGGLRLGGRPMIPASPAGASYSADGSQLEGFYYSEVFALDVTDPDVEPELMWSYSSLDMGLTVGLPSVVSNDGSWYAVIPSGPRTDVPNMPPNAAASGSLWNQPSVTFPREGPYGGNSIQQARLIVLDALNGRHMRTIVSDEPNSFFNNPFLPAAQIRATPWTNHVLYYGMTVARDPRTGMDEGGVYRLQMASADGTPLAVPDWRLARLYDAKRPVTGAVNSAYDSTGNLWVLFGTGRLWSLDDTAPCIFTPTAECRANHDQYIYGIKEELGPEGYLTFADRSDDPLVDVSGVQVYADGTISGLEPETPASEPVTGYDVLAYSIKTGPNAGYRRKLESGNLVFAGTHSYEMVVTQPKIVATGDGRSFITFTSFEPVNEACGGYGNGFLHLADTFTGLPHPSTQFVFHKPGVSPVSGAPAPAGNWVPGVVSTGDGSPSEAFVIYGADGITVGAVAPDASTHTGFIGMGGGSGMRLTSWREVLDTGFGVPPEVMSSGLDGAPPAAPAP